MAKHKKKHPKLKLIGIFLITGGFLGTGIMAWHATRPVAEEAATTDNTVISLPPVTKKSVSPLDLHEKENLSKPQLDPTEGQALHQELIDQHFVGTALIFRNGQILVNQGYGYADFANNRLNTVTSHFQIGSIQKGFTAVLIAKLIAEGKLDYDTHLSQFYPNIPNSQVITINDLLHMSSGLNTTATPTGSTDVQQIEDFYLQHLTSVGPGKFFYTPINYFLLARIVEKLTGDSYENYFRQTYTKGGLQDFGFYNDWYQRSDNTISYSVTASPDDYSKPIHEGEDEFARELGTGNVDMTIGELYWYFHQLSQGHILAKNQLDRLWTKYPGTNYIGGLYDLDDHYRMHGNEDGQRVLMMTSKDFQTGVILMSNRENGKVYNDLMNDLFQKVSGLNARF